MDALLVGWQRRELVDQLVKYFVVYEIEGQRVLVEASLDPWSLLMASFVPHLDKKRYCECFGGYISRAGTAVAFVVALKFPE